MFQVSKIKIALVTVTVISGSLFLFNQAALSDAYFDQGVRLYNQRKYKEAVSYFAYAVKQKDANGNTYLWAALTYSQLGMWGQAKEAYKQAYLQAPNDQTAQTAASYLLRLDPSFLKQNIRSKANITSSGEQIPISQSSSVDTSSNSIPDESKLYFGMDQDRKMVVDAYINNHFTKMIFDTGASGTHFTASQLQNIGILPPTGDPTEESIGIGGKVRAWKAPVTVRIGNPPIVKKVTASVQGEDTGMLPLLGEDVFGSFEYEIDNSGHCIILRKKGVSKASGRADMYSIPFKSVGNEMEINVESKSRKCSVLFDTGAHSTILTKTNLKQLGYQLPEDAPQVPLAGIGGTETGNQFVLDELRVGPIVKHDFPVTIVDSKFGLLGQDFFQDWRYTVDNSNHLIKLFH